MMLAMESSSDCVKLEEKVTEVWGSAGKGEREGEGGGGEKEGGAVNVHQHTTISTHTMLLTKSIN